MAELRAWIRAQREQGYGTLHLSRALALAEAAVREGLDKLTVVSDEDGADFLRDQLPDAVELTVIPRGFTPEQDSAQLIGKMRQFIPDRFDSRHPRPLIYLCGHRYDAMFQRRLWKAGVEVVVVADEGHPTFADWYIVPKPYGGELGIRSVNGYTRFLRGAHYAPFQIRTMKAIYQHREHRTQAQRFAVATENLDLDRWLPAIGRALSHLAAPDPDQEFKPSLLILPGVDDPSDKELLMKLGNLGGVNATVSSSRRDQVRELTEVDVLFAPDGIVLEQALALGTVRICMPRRGTDRDLMYEHLVQREAAMPMPAAQDSDFDANAASMLRRVCFDPSWRRGQNRIGQYLCDGIGSFRIIRQTAFKIYSVPQNIIRFFEMGDPLIPNL